MELIDQIIEETIPIYTRKRPNPATGKEDCQLQRIHKDGKRFMMKKQLLEVISKYKPLTEKEDEQGPAHKKEYT